MKVLLEPSKFRDFYDGRLGVVVALDSSGQAEDGPWVVIGQCACIEHTGAIPELEAHDLASPDWRASVELVQRHYPMGSQAAGIWMRAGTADTEEVEALANILSNKTNLKDVFSSVSTLLVSVCGSGESATVKVYLFDISSSPLKLVPVEQIGPPVHSVSRYLSQHTTMLRLRGSLPLSITTAGNIEKSMLSLSERIESPSTLFLISMEQVLFDENSNMILRNVLPERFKAAGKQSHHREDQMAHTLEKPVMVELLENTSSSKPDVDLPTAPTLRVSGVLAEECVQMTIPVDILGLVRWDVSLDQVATNLKKRISAQLRAIKDEMLRKADILHSVTIHHFSLLKQDCPVTIVYLDKPLAQQHQKETVKSLTNKELHPQQTLWKKTFGLNPKSSELRVLLRNSPSSDSDWNSANNILFEGPQLLTPHLRVKHTKVKDGNMALVQGSYLYFHYMQEGFNDNGWGCAYRSLQTLWSWFLLKDYTNKAVPSHKQIQEALVHVGDKESSFISSKEWIGSFEVSTVLNELMGIQCKIHYCSSGGEMASVGRVLLGHFQTEGTPVMIGGGVLAHTILGVDFNTATGEIQFLILDPHYTGRDDIKTIVEKGWCGWKPVTFWDNTAHYNMCLPLVPDGDI